MRDLWTVGWPRVGEIFRTNAKGAPNTLKKSTRSLICVPLLPAVLASMRLGLTGLRDASALTGNAASKPSRRETKEMWTKCPDGNFRLDCSLEDGLSKQQASLTPRDGKYRLSIEGFGTFRELKSLKEINEILARHRLWPFHETREQCSAYGACSKILNGILEKTSVSPQTNF